MNKSVALLLLIAFFSAGLFVVNQKPKSECANSITCIENLSAEVDNDSQGVFLGADVDVPPIDLISQVAPTQNTQILGESTLDKHIYVDLSKQALYAYEGNDLHFQTLISSGKWGRTPTGEFTIWIKIRATKMSGGSGNDYYYLPNVPYVMFFYNDQIPKSRGFGLHGTYWHNNFGHQMSHGCVNLRTIDAKTLYEWTTPTIQSNTTYASTDNPGTPITICNNFEIRPGEAPLCLE